VRDDDVDGYDVEDAGEGDVDDEDGGDMSVGHSG
jgi:hypothetical protein